jgi:hypothetical protein
MDPLLLPAHCLAELCYYIRTLCGMGGGGVCPTELGSLKP